MLCGLTACVTGGGAGVDNVREQEKLEARKMLENATESPPSSARFVGARSVFTTPYFLTKVSYRPLSLLALPRGLAYLSFACV